MAREVSATPGVALPTIQPDVAREQARLATPSAASGGPATSPEAPDAPPVVIAASIAQLKAGDTLTGQVSGVDTEGHNLLITARGVFAIDPIGALVDGDVLTLTVLRADREIGARIIRQNNIDPAEGAQAVDVRLTLIATPASASATIDSTVPETHDALVHLVRQIADAFADPATHLAPHAAGELDNLLARADDVLPVSQLSPSPKSLTTQRPEAALGTPHPVPQSTERSIADILLLASSTSATGSLDKVALESTASAPNTALTNFFGRLPYGATAPATALLASSASLEPVQAPPVDRTTPLTPHVATEAVASLPQGASHRQILSVPAVPEVSITSAVETASLALGATLKPEGAARATRVSVLAVLPQAAQSAASIVPVLIAPRSPIDILIRSQRAIVATVLEVVQSASVALQPEDGYVQAVPQTVELIVRVPEDARPARLTLPAREGDSFKVGTQIILHRDKTPGPPLLPGERQPTASIEHIKDRVQIDLLQHVIDLVRSPSLQTHLASRLPRPGPYLAGQIIFLLHALKGGSSNWLPPADDPQTQTQRAQILSALGNVLVRRDASSDSVSPTHSHLLLPLALDQTIVPLRLFVEILPPRQELQSEDHHPGSTPSSEDRRFFLTVEFPVLGPLEIHGQTSGNHIGLDVRTIRPLPEALQASASEAFTATLAEQGLGGVLRFSEITSSDPRVLKEQKIG